MNEGGWFAFRACVGGQIGVEWTVYAEWRQEGHASYYKCVVVERK